MIHIDGRALRVSEVREKLTAGDTTWLGFVVFQAQTSARSTVKPPTGDSIDIYNGSLAHAGMAVALNVNAGLPPARR